MNYSADVHIVSGKFVKNLVNAFADNAVVSMISQNRFGWVAFGVFL